MPVRAGSIAVMQPYFLPYAGYFRLFAAAERFVIFDCVQFPRRGWVHRNQFTGVDGALQYLTLPLKKGPQSMSIRDLEFSADGDGRMREQIDRFPSLSNPSPAVEALAHALLPRGARPVDYLESLLRKVCGMLRLDATIERSSRLALDDSLRGQARIIEIARRLGARHYINLAGGRTLYDQAAFRSTGLTLSFLCNYKGPLASIYERIHGEGSDDVARDILAQTVLTE